MSGPDELRIVPPPARRWRVPAHLIWPLSFFAAAVLLFLWYLGTVMGWLDASVVSSANKWLPLTTVNDCLVWMMAALGLNIVVGYAGLLDLGFVAFWAIGGYVAGWMMSDHLGASGVNFEFLGSPAPFVVGGVHINFWLVIVAGAAICALFGVIIGAPTLRLRSDYLALVTLAFGEIIPQVFRNGDEISVPWSDKPFNLSNGTQGIKPIDPIESVTIDKANGLNWRALGPFDDIARYMIFIVLLALLVFISLRLREGRLGRAWLAIREDELAASAMGVPLMRTKLAAYAIGAVAGGVAGVAFAIHLGAVLPDRFTFSISIILLCMVVLGGMGNVWGVLIGAFVLEWVNQRGLQQLGDEMNKATDRDLNIPSYNFLLFGIVLVLMMLFRREGLLPEARTRLVLREPGRTEAEELGADMEQLAPELDSLAAEPPADERRRA